MFSIKASLILLVLALLFVRSSQVAKTIYAFSSGKIKIRFNKSWFTKE